MSEKEGPRPTPEVPPAVACEKHMALFQKMAEGHPGAFEDTDFLDEALKCPDCQALVESATAKIDGKLH